jgi:hypothetical protein
VVYIIISLSGNSFPRFLHMGRPQRKELLYPTYQLDTLQNHFHFIKPQSLDTFRASLFHPRRTLYEHSFGGCSVLLSYSYSPPPYYISSTSFFFFFSRFRQDNCPGCTSALCLMRDPKYSIQHRFSRPVPLLKRQGSFTEVVLISLCYCFGLRAITGIDCAQDEPVNNLYP